MKRVGKALLWLIGVLLLTLVGVLAFIGCAAWYACIGSERRAHVRRVVNEALLWDD